MTKAKTDFAADDFAIARRALWILDDEAPGREQPPLNLDLDRLGTFVGANGVLKALAHFGQSRRDDAQLATGPARAKRGASQRDHAELEPVRHYVMQAEASRLEKRASDLLRETQATMRTAARHWRHAAELRADEENRVGALDFQPLRAVLGPRGEHRAVLAELSSLEAAVDQAVARLEPLLRRMIVGDPYPSILGLPAEHRTVALNQQAVHLFDSGLSLLQVAYVMGWFDGSDEEIQDKTSKRLAHARAGMARVGEAGDTLSD